MAMEGIILVDSVSMRRTLEDWVSQEKEKSRRRGEARHVI